MLEGMDYLIMADILSSILKETVENHEEPHPEKRRHKKNGSGGEVFHVLGCAFK